MPALIEALLEPRAYSHHVESVSLVETHISWVLLTGHFAYKIKKPLDLEFLDFSTLARRRHFCEEELRINRRFAGDLYLEVVPITGTESAPCVGGSGPAIEYAVRMRQFPAGSLLSELAARGALDRAVFRQLGSDLARIHAQLPASDTAEARSAGVPTALRDAVTQNFRQVRPYLRDRADLDLLAAVEQWSRGAYSQSENELWRRQEQGRVRECHGDLHLGNIVLIDGRAVAFDAIEFNASLRWIDTMNELAFLVMDCESRGVGACGYLALNAYLERSGDYPGTGLLDLFCAYRAMVRAKVVLLSGDPPVDRKSESYASYRRYVELAHSYTQRRQCFLAITCGVSGSGKSTVAEVLACEIRAIRMRSDVERKRLFGLAPEASSRADGVGDGIYSAAASERTFSRLRELAASVLRGGHPVIVDATFIRRDARHEFRVLARSLEVPFFILRCDAEEGELRRRVRQRQRSGRDPSEADLEVLEQQLLVAQLPDARSEPETIAVDTARSDMLEVLLAEMLRRLAADT